MNEAYWIKALGMQPHPEGGWFKESYRSPESVSAEALPERFTGKRSLCTSIYYLLGHSDFSAFHRLKADEIWHHYDGGALRILTLDGNGNRTDLLLGKTSGAAPQLTVHAGLWFAAVPEPGTGFVLAGCTVAPGFEFADFELGNREQLLNEYPQHAEIIQKYIRH